MEILWPHIEKGQERTTKGSIVLDTKGAKKKRKTLKRILQFEER